MKAIVLYALQNDFYIGGMLEHPHAAKIIQGIIPIIPQYDLVIIIKKEHPINHPIFAANHPWRKPWQTINSNWGEMMLWPFHTIKGTFGAELIPELLDAHEHPTISVGLNPDLDYRDFFEIPSFKAIVEKNTITALHFAGFCFTEGIYQTANQALSLGIKTLVLPSLTGSVPELKELHAQYLSKYGST